MALLCNLLRSSLLAGFPADCSKVVWAYTSASSEWISAALGAYDILHVYRSSLLKLKDIGKLYPVLYFLGTYIAVRVIFFFP